MRCVWTIGIAIIPLCCILAVPLLDLAEITANDGDTSTSVDDTQEITIGDVIINAHRNAISNPNMKWPGGIVPYTISPLYSMDIQNDIVAAMRQLEQDVNDVVRVCVKFRPRTNESNYIRIYPGNGCRAAIGMQNRGRQDISIGRGCEARGVILHELIHVLGFWHEHNRADRDTYININLTNIRDNTKLDFRQVSSAMLNTLNTPYDLGSIMHYGPYTNAIDKTIPVITPKPGKAVGIQLGQRMALSTWDVVRIQRWYGCTENASHITRTYLTDSLARCDFASSMCNLTHDTTSEFRWTVMEGSSGAGPRAGNTNGADSFLVAKETDNNGTARILTPFFNVGAICVNFFVFQRGPFSYLDVMASGPIIAPVVVQSFQGNNANEWLPVHVDINAPVGAAFQITFEAHLSSGDVAIDDLNIYKGRCI
ncbi:unnamed protein product [Candidula unifasciata]|uniref:Metalloendopeptidase n=1 Tax=Candidula unifasciata TaxID=100452 RepID=A0A8S3Z3S8_9EUPU|nr:unnamed protein product [Candidula unifasciata]